MSVHYLEQRSQKSGGGGRENANTRRSLTSLKRATEEQAKRERSEQSEQEKRPRFFLMSERSE
jgi:hypothetical protein